MIRFPQVNDGVYDDEFFATRYRLKVVRSEVLKNEQKLFYDSKEVQSMLGLGCIRTAQIRIKVMNDELKAKGYWVERGKCQLHFS